MLAARFEAEDSSEQHLFRSYHSQEGTGCQVRLFLPRNGGAMSPMPLRHLLIICLGRRGKAWQTIRKLSGHRWTSLPQLI